MGLMRLQQVAVLVLLSYPVLFVIDRGNLEMVVFIWLAAFFYLYYGRGSRWAWIPLALAIAGKYYWITLWSCPFATGRYDSRSTPLQVRVFDRGERGSHRMEHACISGLGVRRHA